MVSERQKYMVTYFVSDQVQTWYSCCSHGQAQLQWALCIHTGFNDLNLLSRPKEGFTIIKVVFTV